MAISCMAALTDKNAVKAIKEEKGNSGREDQTVKIRLLMTWLH